MATPTTFHLDKATLVSQSTTQIEQQFQDNSYTLRQKLALTCRILFDNGHDSGLAGQITGRAQEPGQYYTQQLGLGFDEITEGNLLLVDEDLNVLEGKGIPNPANRFHSWVYRARPDMQCIIHTHARHTAALGMLEQPLIISHMDTCLLYDDVAFVANWPGVPVGNEEGELISSALGDKRALMLSHHGLLVAGSSVEEACMLALAFERAAQMQLLASSAGDIKPIDPALGKEAHDWVSRPKRYSISFQYYVRRMLKNAIHADCLH